MNVKHAAHSKKSKPKSHIARNHNKLNKSQGLHLSQDAREEFQNLHDFPLQSPHFLNEPTQIERDRLNRFRPLTDISDQQDFLQDRELYLGTSSEDIFNPNYADHGGVQAVGSFRRPHALCTSKWWNHFTQASVNNEQNVTYPKTNMPINSEILPMSWSKENPSPQRNRRKEKTEDKCCGTINHKRSFKNCKNVFSTTNNKTLLSKHFKGIEDSLDSVKRNDFLRSYAKKSIEDGKRRLQEISKYKEKQLAQAQTAITKIKNGLAKKKSTISPRDNNPKNICQLKNKKKCIMQTNIFYHDPLQNIDLSEYINLSRTHDPKKLLDKEIDEEENVIENPPSAKKKRKARSCNFNHKYNYVPQSGSLPLTTKSLSDDEVREKKNKSFTDIREYKQESRNRSEISSE